MCGRFSIADLNVSDLKEIFDLQHISDFDESYNVAPTFQIPAIREYDDNRCLETLRWGLIPPWAKEESNGNRMINARMETLAEKPSFKKPLKSKRCIIPATGFYEWQKIEDKKQPYFIYRADHRPITFAGLWEHWKDRESGEVIESCAIITTSANESLKEIHDRMPLILDYEKAIEWLDHSTKDLGKLNDILASSGDVKLDMHRVSDYVNNVRNDGKQCIEKL